MRRVINAVFYMKIFRQIQDLKLTLCAGSDNNWVTETPFCHLEKHKWNRSFFKAPFFDNFSSVSTFFPGLGIQTPETYVVWMVHHCPLKLLSKNVHKISDHHFLYPFRTNTKVFVSNINFDQVKAIKLHSKTMTSFFVFFFVF